MRDFFGNLVVALVLLWLIPTCIIGTFAGIDWLASLTRRPALVMAPTPELLATTDTVKVYRLRQPDHSDG